MKFRNDDMNPMSDDDDLLTAWYGNAATGGTHRVAVNPQEAEPGKSFVNTEDILAGRYRIAQRIGCGGFASVHSAFDMLLHRWVAVKMYDSVHGGMLAMDEIRIQSVSQHPNLMPLYDAGSDPLLGVTYIVMPLYPGADLRAVLDRYGQMPFYSAISCIGQICSALDYLNLNKHVIHGDVKPSNIWLTGSGAALLMDFNVYGILVRNPECRVGTPGYYAPETLQGIIDERSDVFSLGCVLYECLTGNLPFANDRALIAGRYAPPHIYRPEIRGGLESVIAAAMEINPSRRFQSARQLKMALAHPDAFQRSKLTFANIAINTLKWLIRKIWRFSYAVSKCAWKGIRFSCGHPIDALLITLFFFIIVNTFLRMAYSWVNYHLNAIAISGSFLILILIVAYLFLRVKLSSRHR